MRHYLSILKRLICEILSHIAIVALLFKSISLLADVPQESYVPINVDLPDPAERSQFYEEVVASLGEDCIRCYGSQKFTWNAFIPECVNLFLEAYQAKFPELIEVYQIGETVDDSYKDLCTNKKYAYWCSQCMRLKTCGRILKAVKITSRNKLIPEHKKPVSLFVASIHGQERPPMRVLLDWIDYLTEHYYDNTPAYAIITQNQGKRTTLTITDLLDNYIIWLVPMASPHSWERGDKPNAYHVNLDRDWEYGWASAGGPREHNSDLTGINGWTPLSQPEVRALQGLAESIGPSIYVNMHGQRHSFELNYDLDNLPILNCTIAGVEETGEWAFPYAGSNWEVTTAGHSKSSGIENGAISKDVLRYVYRGVLDDRYELEGEFLFDSLPFLSEQAARFFPCPEETDEKCPPPMYYSPFSEWRACYNEISEIEDRGETSGGGGQGHGFMWAQQGAVSFLFEVPRYYWARDMDNPYNRIADTWFYEKNKNYVEGVDEEDDKYVYWYGIEETEDRFRRVVADAFYALNRLVVISANPIPCQHPVHSIGTGGDRHNLAITGLYSIDEKSGCDFSSTFWPVYGNKCCDPGCSGGPGPESNPTVPECNPSASEETPYAKERLKTNLVRNGYYGKRSVYCKVTNWGNEAHSHAFKVILRVDDVTSETVVPVAQKIFNVDVDEMGAPINGNRHDPVERFYYLKNVTFEKGKIYRVSSELANASGTVAGHYNQTTHKFALNPLNETDNGAFIEKKSIGCKSTEGKLRFCIKMPNEDDEYYKIWKTNNYKEITFKAVIDQNSVCRSNNNYRIKQNINGYPIGHIAPVTCL